MNEYDQIKKLRYWRKVKYYGILFVTNLLDISAVYRFPSDLLELGLLVPLFPSLDRRSVHYRYNIIPHDPYDPMYFDSADFQLHSKIVKLLV